MGLNTIEQILADTVPNEGVPLFGPYWRVGQLAVLAGDTGVGKSTLALQLARAIATGTEVLGQANGMGAQKVLFVGFELSGLGFKQRFGPTDGCDNFRYANLRAEAFLPEYGNAGQKLLNGLERMLKETGAKVVIIDQADRLHLSTAEWNYLLLRLSELRVKQGVSALLVVSHRARNLRAAAGLQHIYRHTQLVPHADTVFCLCQHGRNDSYRYIQVHKNTAGGGRPGSAVAVYEAGEQNGHYTLQPRGVEGCENVLPKSARELLIETKLEAEDLRRQGHSYRSIGKRMGLPESTIRSWVGCVELEDSVIQDNLPQNIPKANDIPAGGDTFFAHCFNLKSLCERTMFACPKKVTKEKTRKIPTFISLVARPRYFTREIQVHTNFANAQRTCISKCIDLTIGKQLQGMGKHCRGAS